jgi:hypothetical protein
VLRVFVLLEGEPCVHSGSLHSSAGKTHLATMTQ